jgi:hypothetical protein
MRLRLLLIVGLVIVVSLIGWISHLRSSKRAGRPADSMTPQAGMQIFMPDLDTIPHNKANQNISLEWLKNRNISPPSDLTAK